MKVKEKLEYSLQAIFVVVILDWDSWKLQNQLFKCKLLRKIISK